MLNILPVLQIIIFEFKNAITFKIPDTNSVDQEKNVNTKWKTLGNRPAAASCPNFDYFPKNIFLFLYFLIDEALTFFFCYCS